MRGLFSNLSGHYDPANYGQGHWFFHFYLDWERSKYTTDLL
jgi:hypothetical protein